MQLSSDVRIPDGLLAANALLSEKPHQGVPSWNLALHQGIDERNSTAAIGLRVGQHLNRAWSRYTGKERDSETGLDYFGARYFSSAQGRFTSPDWSAAPQPVPYADFEDPQTLNLYAYGRNNPLRNRDLDGHCTVDGEQHFGWCIWHSLGLYETQKDRVQDARNFFTNNDVTMGGKAVDPTKLSDQQVLAAFRQFNDDWRSLVQQGANPVAAMSPIMTPWGWSGSKPYRDALTKLNEVNTPQNTADHQDLNGKVPSRDDAKRMIEEAGGKVVRGEEQAHGPDSVSHHDYPHINYETASGNKGTIRVKE
jgi:RHS repeat-associated protein